MSEHRASTKGNVSLSSEEERREIQCGSKVVSYTLAFAPRERLSISVHPDLRVTAIAPLGRAAEEIDARVRARANWILKQRRRFERYHPLPQPKRFVSGETHWYLGRQYRLRVSAGEESVALRGAYFDVTVADRANTGRIKALLDRWYRTRAKVVFPYRLAQCVQATSALVHRAPVLRIQKMTRRWGSCTEAGTIILNLELIKAPISCIDYVIVHELCHLKVMSHGLEFYRTLSRYMPDWERRQDRLNAGAR